MVHLVCAVAIAEQHHLIPELQLVLHNQVLTLEDWNAISQSIACENPMTGCKFQSFQS
jgi:hypothetical protein